VVVIFDKDPRQEIRPRDLNQGLRKWHLRCRNRTLYCYIIIPLRNEGLCNKYTS
jgi:hypothetical protein